MRRPIRSPHLYDLPGGVEVVPYRSTGIITPRLWDRHLGVECQSAIIADKVRCVPTAGRHRGHRSIFYLDSSCTLAAQMVGPGDTPRAHWYSRAGYGPKHLGSFEVLEGYENILHVVSTLYESIEGGCRARPVEPEHRVYGAGPDTTGAQYAEFGIVIR